MTGRVIRWVLVVIWCVFIFVMSDKPADASNVSSGWFVNAANHFLQAGLRIQEPVITQRFVRKAAHFIEYMVLGFLLFSAFGKDTWGRFSCITLIHKHPDISDTREPSPCIFFRKWLEERCAGCIFILTVVSGFLYSVTDEIHQYFIPGRAMRFSDVLIDTAGILLSASLIYIRRISSLKI